MVIIPEQPHELTDQKNDYILVYDERKWTEIKMKRCVLSLNYLTSLTIN
jgi:hypothetical protein